MENYLGHNSWDDNGATWELNLYPALGSPGVLNGRWYSSPNNRVEINTNCFDSNAPGEILKLVAHEWGHAVADVVGLDKSGTYNKDPGALDEGFADCLAHIAYGSDWRILVCQSMQHRSRRVCHSLCHRRLSAGR